MPSITHDGMLQPFEHRPELAAELLAGAPTVALPAWRHARLGSGDLTELVPAEFRADRVVVLSNAKAKAVLGVILEVQLGKDVQKRYSWPVYVATLRSRLRCPVALLVVSPYAGIAAWCAKPIELGPASMVTPVVLGPDQLPLVTDVCLARSNPDLALLSALAHGRAHPDRKQVLTAFLEALHTLRTVDRDRAEVYHDVVRAALPAARGHLEELMSTKGWVFQSDFAIRHRREGKAEAMLAVLDARGIEVPEDARERINRCTDLKQLDRWVRRAGKADSIHDVLDN
jgi:hypothetical protein